MKFNPIYACGLAVAFWCAPTFAEPFDFAKIEYQSIKGAQMVRSPLPNGWKLKHQRSSNPKTDFNNQVSFRVPIKITRGQQYVITGKLSSTQPMTINVDLKSAQPPWRFVGGQAASYKTFKLTPTEINFELPITAEYNYEPTKCKLNFYFGNNIAGAYFFVTDLAIVEKTATATN